MSLLQMSFSGGVLILAVVVLRALTLNRLPKKTFLALWAVAVLRLLVPLSIPSVFSFYSLLARAPAAADTPAANWIPAVRPAAPVNTLAPSGAEVPIVEPPATVLEIDLWMVLWLAGAVLCGVFFLLAYLRAWREFQTSLPLQNEFLDQWLENHPLRRRIFVRQSDRISAPLTYGLFHPVILLPKNTDWSDLLGLNYVLQHEYIHIRRWDAVWKCLLTLALCVHWFNPLVWVMYLLTNRDLELACDEAVVRSFGAGSRADYARTLISMEEKKGVLPFCSHFSRQALEERIVAIMKIKKTTVVSLLLAVVLVLGTAVAFATSAQPEETENTPSANPMPESIVADPYRPFAEVDAKLLLTLRVEGYADMTVADYQEKLWTMADDLEMREMIERFSLYGTDGQLSLVPELKDEFETFREYFFNVFEPLTAEQWQRREFSGCQLSEPFGGKRALVEYVYALEVLDRDTLTVGEYEETRKAADQGFLTLLDGCTEEQLLTQERMTALLDEKIAALAENLSNAKLRVTLVGYSAQPLSDDPDVELHAGFSSDVSNDWDRLLTPYVSFGLTYEFNDPDLDGNGLTMWYQGKEVRGIMDEHEGWITEHAGIGSYSPDAVELYAVYTDGKLTGLRFATEEEQALWTQSREDSSASLGPVGYHPLFGEPREYPQATREDYDAILSLRTSGYENLSLEEFNQRLLDWNEAHFDAADRIMCDVIWDDYGVELTTEEQMFVSHTCLLSNRENAAKIRALHTGDPEEDPHISANLPSWSLTLSERDVACFELYYDISYHISDKSAITVAARDNYISAMMVSIQEFWQESDAEQLLSMTEDQVVDQFNAWVAQLSAARVHPITGETRGITINPVTADDISFSAMIVR